MNSEYQTPPPPHPAPSVSRLVDEAIPLDHRMTSSNRLDTVRQIKLLL